ncbi:class I SAM-dependent methyltransferase [Streptomyces varsoviensis]|uniref:class I SAM-dependent methyltransferase n=1 Tax=Streptomyces varsoviensis TaxID=67373 RepID=UPI0004C972EF|nr:methyltransferase domain-containing protein [Streptomyces varsoviensis]
MSEYQRAGSAGAGPGAITPDGCAVEMYARMEADGEQHIVAGAMRAGARTILELGAGAGRVTHALLDLGFEVVAVDESPEMLAEIRGARTVRATIEGLDLGERFDAVLLASYLINTAEPAVRAELLRTCRRHVKDDGCVLIQREGAGWNDPANVPREHRRGPLLIRVAAAEPLGAGVTSVRMEYEFEGRRWSQTHTSHELDEAAVEKALAEAGLRLDAHLTDDRTWLRAVPAATG